MNAQLAAVIVHDIKNALGVLEGELQSMTLQPTREQAVLAHQTCVSLRDKLIGFLTLYKASSQGLAARVDAVSPHDFLHALIKGSSHRPALTVSVNEQNMPAMGFFDDHLVGLALEAALQNAARFASTAIELGCMTDEIGQLVFSVRDDGPGLGAKEGVQSTGLGMELCEAIAAAHRKGNTKGTASLDNHPDGGAIFTLRLP